ncbi:MAG: DUF4430 domain-containing protein [Proteocatella sp.]
MKKRFKKFLSVLTILALMITNVGFADTQSKSLSENVAMLSVENVLEKGTEEVVESKTTTESALKLEKMEVEKKSEKEAVIVIERATLGQSFYMEPTVVSFNEGDNLAKALTTVIGEGNYKNTGSVESSFYLSQVKLNDNLAVNVPNHIIEMGLDPKDIEENKDEWLGEFDHAGMSGWMYWKNNSMLNVGMSDTLLEEGDVIRVQFTIYGYGQDLGLGFDGNAYDFANKDNLVKELAYINEDKSVLENNEALRTAYDKGVELMLNMKATQEEIDDAVSNIKNPVVVEADKALLSAKITEAEAVKKELYTEESVKSFEEKLSKAKAINEKSGVSQTEADKALKELKNSILELKREEVSVQWPSFRGNKENHGVVTAKLPVPDSEIETKWIQKYGAGWSGNGMASIVVDDSIYIVGSSKLQKRSLEDGKIIAETKVPNGINFYSNLGYGNGNIYVPSAKGTVNAFDAKTLEFLWTSESVGNFQNLSAIQYHEGLVYAGFTSGGTSGGVFAAFNSVTGKVEWKYGEGTSYYQTGAVMFGDNVIFAGDDAKLVSADAKTGKETDTLSLSGGVRCIPVKDEDYLYLTTKAGNIYKIEVSSDGTFGEELSYNAGTQGTTSPVIYNGRVYAGFGGMGTGGSVAVLDEEMNLVYEAKLPGPTQSSPILTSGYATEENNHKVYVYFSLNNANGTVVCLEDDAKNTVANVKTVYQPDPEQYSMSSPIAGEDGTIYYTNDSGNIFAFKGKEAPPVVEADKALLSAKITEAEAVKKELYTEESVKAFEEKLSKAKAINEKSGVSQTEVDNSLSELISSIDKLVKKPQEPKKDYKVALDSTLKFIYKNTPNPTVGTFNGEWSIIALSRGGYSFDANYINKYYNNVISELEKNKGILHSKKYTEYSRVALGLTAIGENPSNAGKYNLLEKIAEYDNVIWQGINGPIWAIIALDSNSYDIPNNKISSVQTTREKLIQTILSEEITKNGVTGGFSLDGKKPDPDITAMALQALAPYKSDKKVNDVIERSLEVLSKMQADDGEFISYNDKNSESTAQVIIALSNLGIDAKTDKRFIKNEKNPIDVLLKYHIEGSGFKHIYSDKSSNGMATDQAALALVAYDRFVNNKTNIYDMSDVELKTKKTEKLELKDGEIEVPLDNDKNFDVELKSDQKAKIVIPENTESKILLKTETKKPLSEIKVKKGNQELKIPQGVKIEEGHAEIELFAIKTESEKAEIKNELSNKIKKLDSKVKDVNVEDAFKIGNTNRIEFSDYVELVFTNMAGKGAAYVDDTGLHIIERVVDDKSGNGKNEYAFDRGSDLVVKTNHFTDFVAYTVEKDTLDQGGNSGTPSGGTAGGTTGGSGGGVIPTKEITVTLSIDKQTIDKGYVLEPTVIKINKGDTVWNVLQKEMDARGISYRFSNSNQFGSVYVESIDGDGEFDHGRWSGWMYNVNGTYPNYGCSKYILNGGETIQWRYTTNLGKDLGVDNSAWGKSVEGSGSEATEKGSTIVKADAKVDKKEAKAEIEDKRISGAVKEAVEKKLTQIVVEPAVEDKKAEFNKVTSVLEKVSIEKIAKEAKVSLKLKTKFGDVKLSQKSLEELLKQSGNTVTISVKQNEDNTVSVELKAGLNQVEKISGSLIVSLPYSEGASSAVLVKIMPDKTEQILMNSIAGDKVISAKLDGSSTVKIVQRKVDFADTSSHWAKENIEFVSARDIIKGTKKDQFSPNSRVNRAMLTTILHRFENEVQVEGENYSDVAKDAYYVNAALWAKTNGIISNADKFDAKEELTREQIAQMIYNYAKASGEDVSNISKENVKKFEDFAKVEKASQEAVAYCYESGIIGGKSETKLDPKGKTTRAEVSAIIQRYINATI